MIMNNKIVFILLLILSIILPIILILVLLLAQNYYYSIINKYFRNSENKIIYDYYLKNCIQVVSEKNYYMNYGFWDNENITLNKANKNLCNFIYEKGRLNSHDEFTILDVGCGYGVQDILWSKKISNTSNLIAVDISKKQIKYANKKLRCHAKIQNKLTYMECDAHHLLDKFANNNFNRIISLESAFHYNNRKQFFKNVSDLLTNDGIFVISDIVLKSNNKNTTTTNANLYNNNLFKNIFIKIASDFLCIPEKNLITFDKWKNEVENSDLCIIETYNITDKTFNSYYNYFFKNYIKNKKLPTILYSILYHIFNTIQPFDYIVSVCKKKT